MTTKKCRWCGKQFTPTIHLKRYCSDQCRALAYNENRRLARKRYNQKNPRKRPPTIRLCNWCAKPFTSRKGIIYCCIKCRKEARREQVNRNVKHYKLLRGKSDKQYYFDNLGNSNLREHRKKSFTDEEKVIRAEIRRLGI